MPKGFFTGKSRQQEPALHDITASLSDTATCRPPAFHRPRLSDRQGQEKQGQEKQTPTATSMDLKNAVPPVETISPLTTADLDENLIGIALGSPRLVESQMYSHMRDDSSCSTTGNQRPGLGKSRWRKIGGLFKTKRAPAASQPFYQLRVNSDWPLPDSTYSIDLEDEKSRTEDVPPDEWPRFKQRKGDHDSQDSRAKTKENGDTSPLLQVDIPNIRMERYSVMFSGPLGKKARKNRIEETPPELPDLPPPPRPSSSPQPKSPSFTLFPATHASKPSKVLGPQNLPGPSPLTISQTALADQPSWRESSLWPSPLRIPESRRQPSDSSSTTIDLNVGGPPLQSSKPVDMNQTCTQTSPPKPNLQLKPIPVRPQALRINTNVQSFHSATNKSTSANITIKPSPRSSSLTANTIPKRSSPNTSHPKAETSSSPGTPLNTTAPAKTTTPTTTNTTKSKSKEESIPKIEISVARSVSVSRGHNKQSLIPIRRTEFLDTDERLVDQRAKTPTVMDGENGHRHGNSQDARIESV